MPNSVEGGVLYEYVVLVTSLDEELQGVAQFRDRGDAENNFDELKNQWGWTGFTTQDLKRSREMAGVIALVYNWWGLFTRLAAGRKGEAITTRPLLLHGIARRTRHARQTTLTITSSHAKTRQVRRSLEAASKFLKRVAATAEQLGSITHVPRPRDAENNFDELKNQWGWTGFTTQDLKRSREMAGVIALVYNWWGLFTRLAAGRKGEAITTRPLLLHGIARHARQTTLTITSSHAKTRQVRRSLEAARFLKRVAATAEQLGSITHWRLILSWIFRDFLHGRVVGTNLQLADYLT